MAKLLFDGRNNVIVAIVFIAVDTIAVILRVISKLKTTNRVGQDDGWIIFGLACFYVWACFVIHGKLRSLNSQSSMAKMRLSACFLQGSLDPKYLYFKVPNPDSASEVFKVNLEGTYTLGNPKTYHRITRRKYGLAKCSSSLLSLP